MIISKSTRIFLGIFTFVFIIFTVIMINYTNTHTSNDNSKVIIDDAQKNQQNYDTSNIKTTDTAPTKGVSIDDTYSYNGIKYAYIIEEENISLKYPKISGLKDESVEDSINTQIRERINKILDSNNFKKNSDSSAYVKADVVANFSDVLSIKIFVKFNENYNKNYGINFRLDNGERIKLNELFTGIAPKKNIISEAAYRSFALDYYTEEGLSNDFYTNIEPDIINFMTDYNNDKVSEFIFTPLYIEIYKDGKTVKINMKDYAEYIAIYNSFKSSVNLYKNIDDVAKNIPVFTQRPDTIIDLYEKINETCIMDVIIYKDTNIDKFSSSEEKTIKAYKENLVKRLETLREEKGLYYTNYVKISRVKEENNTMLVFSENEKFVQIEESKFISDVYEKILDAERNADNDISYESKINVLEKKLIEHNTNDKKYIVGETEEYIKQNNEETNTIESVSENANTVNQTNTNVIQNTTESNVTNNVVTNETSSQEQNITTQVYF